MNIARSSRSVEKLELTSTLQAGILAGTIARMAFFVVVMPIGWGGLIVTALASSLRINFINVKH